MLGYMHPSSCLGTFSSFNQHFRPSYHCGKRLWRNRTNVQLLHRQDIGVFATGHHGFPHFEGWKRHAHIQATIIKKKVEDNKDIIIDDLFATLEAHRATNKSRIIRKIPSPNPYDLDQTQTAPSLADVKTIVPEARTTSQGDAATNQIIVKRQLMGTKRKRTNPSHKGPKLPLGYKGVAKKPHEQWKPRSPKGRERSPWLPLVTSTEGDGLTRLQNEIKAYENYMTLTPYEMAAAHLLLKEIKSIAKEIDRSVSVDLVGSYSSGLATPMSDMDLRISLTSFNKNPLDRGPSPGRKLSLDAGERSLDKLQRALMSRPKSFDKVWVARSRRLYILNAKHRKTKLAVQIQFLPNPPASLTYIATYLSEFPALRPLYVLLSSALNMRGLSFVPTGGLGSYSLFMMIVYALNQNASKLSRHDIAAQLLSILKLYSEADLYKYGFSPDPPRIFDKSIVGMRGNSTAKLYGVDVMCKHDDEPFLLCLQDPADPTNDLGCRTRAIKHVQAVFHSARERIEQAMREWEAMTQRERQNVNEGCLDPLVGACYTGFEEQRSLVKRVVGKG